jgi:hypothetical protein
LGILVAGLRETGGVHVVKNCAFVFFQKPEKRGVSLFSVTLPRLAKIHRPIVLEANDCELVVSVRSIYSTSRRRPSSVVPRTAVGAIEPQGYGNVVLIGFELA